MADPEAYEVAYSFANFQSNDPTSPLPGARVDTELAGVETAIADLVEAVKDVRRSDGALKNGIVTVDAMSAGVIAALTDLDEDAADSIDAAIALVKTDLETELTEGLALKAALVHTHAATAVSVSAITGIVGITVQAVLAELRLLGPQSGDLRLSIDDAVAAGWVACNDGTIGDATSSASNRANADCATLYALLWNKVSDTYAPVTTGRGLSATADFAAHKPIALTKMLGRALAVAGSGSGLSVRANGQTAGAETVTLDSTMVPATAITGSGTVTPTVNSGTAAYAADGQSLGVAAGAGFNVTASSHMFAVDTKTVNITGTVSGGGLAHANVQPTAFLHAYLKL